MRQEKPTRQAPDKSSWARGPHKLSSVSRTAASDRTAGQGHFSTAEDLALLQNRRDGDELSGGFDSRPPPLGQGGETRALGVFSTPAGW